MTLGRRRTKYGNRRTVVDGVTFHSKREAGEWVKLRMLEKGGKISLLRRQVIYPLLVNSQLVCRYVADFEWWEDGRARGGGRIVVADAKGYRTPEYKIKKALMKAIHGIEIREL